MFLNMKLPARLPTGWPQLDVGEKRALRLLGSNCRRRNVRPTFNFYSLRPSQKSMPPNAHYAVIRNFGKQKAGIPACQDSRLDAQGVQDVDSHMQGYRRPTSNDAGSSR